jgi:small subunit ribosomal protein S2
MSEKANHPSIDSMFKAGVHFAFSKSRRHPTTTPFIFGSKNKVEIFDLEKVAGLLDKAKDFIHSLAKEGKTIMIVGGKSEARNAVRKAGEALGMPYVDRRWIGGTLTNFPEIKKRIDKYEKLIAEREKGELAKYTKKERLLIDKEISNLEGMFSGIVSLKDTPKAIVIVDPRREKNAVKEALDKNVPIISIAGSDCNLAEISYPVVGNDASKSSIEFFMEEITRAYNEGKKAAVANTPSVK